MKYIEEFRDGNKALILAKRIKTTVLPGKKYRLMEFCGGHTHAIYRNGILDLLPQNIEMVHGPGCPVCVLPITKIDSAIYLASQPDVIFCSYADMLKVPGTHQNSLLKTKAKGHDIRIIYSVDDALDIAKKNPQKKVIFFAIGFETTTPPTAAAIVKAQKIKLKNFFVFCNHVLTAPALKTLLSDQKNPMNIDGFIGPAHVSIIIGYKAYDFVANVYKKPIVISGFEPLDLMQSILMLVQSINNKQHRVENQYTRAVSAEGNCKSQQLMADIFSVRDHFEWRGFGDIANSAIKINKKYQAFDAEEQFLIPRFAGKEHKACICAEILKGQSKPRDCKLFRVVCSPENPLGACMVSQEGACSAIYQYSVEKCDSYDKI